MLMIFFRVAVDQRDFAGVAQRDRHQVLDVVLVHLLLRPLGDRDDDLPRRLHFLHPELGRRRRRLLDVARHQVDLLRCHLAGGLPVRHAGRRAVGDEHLEVVGTLAERDVGGERLAGGALAQHAVTAGAALEVDLARLVEFRLRHRRRLRIDVLMHLHSGEGRSARSLVPEFLGGHPGRCLQVLLWLLIRVGHADGERQRRQGKERRARERVPSCPSHRFLPSQTRLVHLRRSMRPRQLAYL